MVQRLRLSPLTAATGVRFPTESPKNKPERDCPGLFFYLSFVIIENRNLFNGGHCRCQYRFRFLFYYHFYQTMFYFQIFYSYRRSGNRCCCHKPFGAKKAVCRNFHCYGECFSSKDPFLQRRFLLPLHRC